MKQQLLALGLMSGTSMDGVDASLIQSDGAEKLKVIGSTSLKYSKEFQTAFKKLEQAVHSAEGNLESVKALPQIEFLKLVQKSTEYHAQAVEELLEKLKYSCEQVDLIGYHGQTVFHRPQKGITLQLGNADWLANKLGIKVVYDFRSNDLKHGGQGAPLAPIYHYAKAAVTGILPAVILNCGGITNPTIITGKIEQLCAFDAGPGNTLLDRFVREKTNSQETYDAEGKYAAAGTVSEALLQLLFSSAVQLSDGSNYFDQQIPKSLDVNDCILIPEIRNLSLADGCATLAAFTAEAVIRGALLAQKKGIKIPLRWILSGGGWKNPAIVKELTQRLRNAFGAEIQVEHAAEVNWNSDSLEAELFAYLAIRSFKGLPLSFPGTTGVKVAVTGGRIANRS